MAKETNQEPQAERIKCTKVAFFSHKAAKERLVQIKQRGVGVIPTDCYLCHNCGLWHLTSQKRR